jgi:hypothetical protein
LYSHLILRELFEDLDAVVYRLMTDGEDDGSWSKSDYKSWGKDIGEAQGLALAIAKIHNLSEPNINWVREEAMRRWEKHLEEPTPIGTGARGDLRRLGNPLRSDGNRRGGFVRVGVPRGGWRMGLGARPRLGAVRRVAGRQGER